MYIVFYPSLATIAILRLNWHLKTYLDPYIVISYRGNQKSQYPRVHLAQQTKPGTQNIVYIGKRNNYYGSFIICHGVIYTVKPKILSDLGCSLYPPFRLDSHPLVLGLL